MHNTEGENTLLRCQRAIWSNLKHIRYKHLKLCGQLQLYSVCLASVTSLLPNVLHPNKSD